MFDFDARAKDWDEAPERVERANAVAVAIREAIPLSRTMTALEYGCGTGLLSFALRAELGSIVLADSSSGMLEVLKGKIAAAGAANMTPIKLDLIVDPLPPQRFDLIYTLMALHHILDTAKVLRGFHSLLRPGGVLCVVDLDREDGSFHQHSPEFIGHNGLDRAELSQLLSDFGFVDVRLSTCYEVVRGERRYPLFLAVAEAE